MRSDILRSSEISHNGLPSAVRPVRPRDRLRASAVAAMACMTLLAPATPSLADEAQDPGVRTHSVTLQADRDAFGASGRPDENFDGDRLCVGERPGYGATRSVLAFDLDELDPKEVVIDADLRLYQRDSGPSGDGGREIVVRRVRDDWDEERVTWNRFPGSDDGRIASESLGTSSGWRTWDIGALARRWYREEIDNDGVYVQGYETGGSFRCFDSREGSQEPELELEVAIDNMPPVSVLNPLPPFTNVPDIVLTWAAGEDPEPASGIVSYGVYVRRGEEPWWLVERIDDHRARSYTFRGALSGYQYGFQLVATDRAGNVEVEGPAEAQTLVDLDAPQATMSPLPIWSNGPFTISWTAVDHPIAAGLASSGVAEFYVQYSIEGGAWAPIGGPTTATSMPFEPTVDLDYQFRVSGVDLAGNPEPFGEFEAATRIDRAAPSARLLPTRGIDSPVFPVHWEGDDHGRSGVAAFDIEFRTDHGPWRAWRTYTPVLSDSHEGEYGHFYEFRIRAHDVAGNVGPWPERPGLGVLVIESEKLSERVFLPIIGW